MPLLSRFYPAIMIVLAASLAMGQSQNGAAPSSPGASLRPATSNGATDAGRPAAAESRPVLMAEMHPQLLWKKVSPNAEHTDGPVLYQLLFSTGGTPNTIAKFDTNPRHLANSDITDAGHIVSVGGSGFTIDANTGVVHFVNAQTFPGTISSVATGTGLTGGPITSTGTISLDTTFTDARYLQLSGGTLTGTVTFAAGQTFPGSGTVTNVASGTGLSGGPITTSGTLSIDTTVVPRLGATNTFSALNTFNGGVSGSTASFSGNIATSGGVFNGDGSGLINLSAGALASGTVPQARLTGLYNIDISGNAASATTAATATTATTATTANNALALGGNAADLYSTTAQNDTRYLQLSGGTLTGGLVLGATGTATAGGGFNSNVTDLTASAFNSGTAAENETFRWQAEPAGNNTASPSGSLNLLFSGTSNAFTPTETGLSVAGSGLITFAPGQTFPGSGGTVTQVDTGAGLTGGPITTTGTISIASAGVTNAMLANPSLTVTPGPGLSGGGLVALGGATTLNLDTTFTDARYLSLGGGTLTGSLAGTSASFSGNVSSTGGVFSGDGSSLTNLNAGNLASGTVAAARLTGTYNISISGNAATATTAGALSGVLPAANGGTGLNTSTGTNFLRGDGAGAWTSSTIAVADVPALSGTIYDAGGNKLDTAHTVVASATLDVAGNGSVTFTGAAVFSDATTYVCVVRDTTNPANVLTITYVGGTNFTLASSLGATAAADSVRYSCTGN